MPLPAPVVEPICAGILEFLSGWAMVAFLATCKTAQGARMHNAAVQDVKDRFARVNAFLRAAVMQGRLWLPGFDRARLASAQLFPVDMLPRLPGRNMQRILDETFAMNPRPPTSEAFRDWLAIHRPEYLEDSDNVSFMLHDNHGAGSSLSGSPDFELLSEMLSRVEAPLYSPDWGSTQQCPILINGLAALHHPAFLLIWCDYKGFPVLLYARAKILALPWAVVLR